MTFLHSSAIGINKTAVIFLRASSVTSFGGNFNPEQQYKHKLNYIYNFENQSWVRIIDLPDEMAFKSYNLPLAITFDKNSTTHLQVFGFHRYLSGGYTPGPNEVTLWTLDLCKMEWMKLKSFSEIFVPFGKDEIQLMNTEYIQVNNICFQIGTMLSIGGLLHYFPMPNEDLILGYALYNATNWITLPHVGLLSCSQSENVSCISVI